MENKKHYCTVENDGVAVCVCKHRPCEQLKRKEQECEEWKHQAELSSETINRLAIALEEKEQEYEELKAQDYKNLKYFIKTLI